MLWLCLHFPHLPIELREPADGPLAITERAGGRRHVLAANRIAQSLNVHPSLDVTVALTRAPTLTLLERTPPQEKKALKALVTWAYQWSSEVTWDFERWLIALEVGSSVRYFGNLAGLRDQVLNGSRALGYTASIGIAPTWECAALLARSNSSLTIENPKDIVRTLRERPLEDLALSASIRDHLKVAGLRSIADVLRIPRDALARRFGAALTDYLQRLLGECPDPRPRFKPKARYERVHDCAYPIADSTALLFPLRRLLQELQGYLRGGDVAVESILIGFDHHDAPTTRLEVRMSSAQRDAAAILPLLREQLERTVLPEPVLRIRVKAERLVAPLITQRDLFDAPKRYELEWSALLDRLRARLGEDAIRELHLMDNHLPERAWCIEHTDFTEDSADPLPERPVWLLTPKLLDRLPKLLGDPERIEAGWLEGSEQRRDYYLAETPEGALWWVYRDGTTYQWFLHGIWA